MLPDLGEIEKRRRKIGLTQTQLARLAGVSQSLIAKIESGRANPAYSVVKSIFTVLDEHENKEALNAADLMTKSIIGARKSDSVEKVAKLMRQHGVSQIPVMEGDSVIGSVSESTLARRMADEQNLANLSKLPISQLMGGPFPVVDESVPVSALTPLLMHSDAVVVSRKGKPAGIITKADLLKAVHK